MAFPGSTSANSHLNTEITNELSRYDRIYAAWNAALQTTQDRLGFIPKTRP